MLHYISSMKGLKTSLEISEAGVVLLLFPVSEGSHQLDFKVLVTADQTNVFKQNPWLEPQASDGDHQPGLGRERRVGWVC